MTEYGTDEQWIEICESALNGNWSQSAQECVDYGFWANDMIKKYQAEDYHILSKESDIAILSEMAMKLRNEED